MPNNLDIPQLELSETWCQSTNGAGYSLAGQAICRVFNYLLSKNNDGYVTPIGQATVPIDVVHSVISAYYNGVRNDSSLPEVAFRRTPNPQGNQRLIVSIAKTTGRPLQQVHDVLYALDDLASQGKVSQAVAYPRTQGNDSGILPSIFDEKEKVSEPSAFASTVSTLKWTIAGVGVVAGLYFLAQTAGVVQAFVPKKK